MDLKCPEFSWGTSPPKPSYIFITVSISHNTVSIPSQTIFANLGCILGGLGGEAPQKLFYDFRGYFALCFFRFRKDIEYRCGIISEKSGHINPPPF